MKSEKKIKITGFEFFVPVLFKKKYLNKKFHSMFNKVIYIHTCVFFVLVSYNRVDAVAALKHVEQNSCRTACL